MKKTLCLLLALLLCLLPACSHNLTDKESILRVYSEQEENFVAAAQSGDFSELEKLRGVQKVYVWEDYVDIQCGGSGFGPSTSYYGIFYSEADDLLAVDVAMGRAEELQPEGDGYWYRESDGDNRYSVEPLGNHYFYYEAHF